MEDEGFIEIVSDDVFEWIVPCPKDDDGFSSPKFLVDAYNTSLYIDDGEFSIYVHDSFGLLLMDQATVSLVDGEKSRIVFSGKIINAVDESLVRTFKISKADLDEFTTSDGRLRTRCSFKRNWRAQRIALRLRVRPTTTR